MRLRRYVMPEEIRRGEARVPGERRARGGGGPPRRGARWPPRHEAARESWSGGRDRPESCGRACRPRTWGRSGDRARAPSRGPRGTGPARTSPGSAYGLVRESYVLEPYQQRSGSPRRGARIGRKRLGPKGLSLPRRPDHADAPHDQEHGPVAQDVAVEIPELLQEQDHADRDERERERDAVSLTEQEPPPCGIPASRAGDSDDRPRRSGPPDPSPPPSRTRPSPSHARSRARGSPPAASAT